MDQEYKKMSIIKRNKIRKELIDQLKTSGHDNDLYIDMIDHYMELVDLKELIQADIAENGLRILQVNIKGDMVKKPNESVANLVKVSGQMLKILTDLELKKPKESKDDDDL